MSRHVDVTPFVAELQIYANHLKDKYGECAVQKTLETVIEQIGELPTADVAPIVHAHWDEEGNCSHCGNYMEYQANFCPHCGAKMDEN